MDSLKVSDEQLEARRSLKLMKRMLVGFRAHLDEELREEGVTTAQLRFLDVLKQHPDVSGAQLARACYVTPQSAQAMMKRAVERGWVVRGKSAENHRLVTARLSRRGEKLLAHAESVMARMEVKVWRGVSVDRLRAMNLLMEAALKKLNPKP